MVSSQCKIGVVGAGSSGLFLGILLTQQGYQVDIFEKFPDVRTDGCGILLVTSGMKALQAGSRQLCEKLWLLELQLVILSFAILRVNWLILALLNIQPMNYQQCLYIVRRF